MDSTINYCADTVWQKSFKEVENVSSSKEQKKLQRTGNSGRLACATVLDCSHLLLIVAIGIIHAMLVMQCKARPQWGAFIWYGMYPLFSSCRNL